MGNETIDTSHGKVENEHSNEGLQETVLAISQRVQVDLEAVIGRYGDVNPADYANALSAELCENDVLPPVISIKIADHIIYMSADNFISYLVGPTYAEIVESNHTNSLKGWRYPGIAKGVLKVGGIILGTSALTANLTGCIDPVYDAAVAQHQATSEAAMQQRSALDAMETAVASTPQSTPFPTQTAQVLNQSRYAWCTAYTLEDTLKGLGCEPRSCIYPGHDESGMTFYQWLEEVIAPNTGYPETGYSADEIYRAILELNPEISEMDYTRSIQELNFNMPGAILCVAVNER